MSDAFDPNTLREESIINYLKNLNKVLESDMYNASDDPLDRNLTIISMNETEILSYTPDPDKICGLILAKESTSMRNAYLEMALVEMLKNDEWVKLFGMSIDDVIRLPFSRYRFITKILDKYKKQLNQITEDEENKLKKENDKLKEQIKLLTQQITKQ